LSNQLLKIFNKYILISFADPMDYFSLDGLSGDLTTAKPIDRESLSNNNGIITLTVRVSLNLYILFYLIFVYILIFF
jgi:hypothetical protein